MVDIMPPSLAVDSGIRDKLPGLKILIGVVRDIDPSQVDSKGCSQLLSAAWQAARQACSALPNVQSHPRIAAWRHAYQNLGIPVKKYTTSIENLVKRACKEGSEPRSICPLVDFYNACSLHCLIPFGGFDMDVDGGLGGGELVLRWSREGDTFHALDADSPADMPAGEAVYAAGSVVLTRHVNWKQSREALIGDTTRNVVFMAEVLAEVEADVIAEMTAFLSSASVELLKRPMTITVMKPEDSIVTY